MTVVHKQKSFVDRLFAKKWLGRISALHFCLLVFAFPLTSAMPVLLNTNSTPINLALRVLYLGMSTYLLIGGLTKRASWRLPIAAWLVIAFWILYSLRLIYDREFRDIPFTSVSDFKFYSMAFGSCFLAALAGILTARFLSIKQIQKFVFATVLLSNISIIAICYYLFQTVNPIELATRLNFTVELGDKSISVLNPITIAYHGEVLGLLSLLCLTSPKSKHIFFYSLTLIVGVFVLLLGASRGPMISFLLIAAYIFFANYLASRKNEIFYIKLVTLLTVIYGSFRYFIYPKIEWSELTVINRLQSWLEGGGTARMDNRDEKYSSAWQQFLDNPILGDQYLDRLGGYPHNLYLESFMSLGLLGGLLFFSLAVICLIKISRLLVSRRESVFFSVLTLAVLLSAMTSGSLFTAVGFWVCVSYFNSVRV